MANIQVPKSDPDQTGWCPLSCLHLRSPSIKFPPPNLKSQIDVTLYLCSQISLSRQMPMYFRSPDGLLYYILWEEAMENSFRRRDYRQRGLVDQINCERHSCSVIPLNVAYSVLPSAHASINSPRSNCERKSSPDIDYSAYFKESKPKTPIRFFL